MDNGNSNEKLQSAAPETTERVSSPNKPEHSKEFKDKAKAVLKSGENDEQVEGQDGSEAIDGKISESESSPKDQYSGSGSGKKQMSDDQIEAIRAKLLAALPPQEVMIKEIKNKLKGEQKVISKRISKIKGKAHLHAFELTKLVGSLRKVKEQLAVLAHATYEMIKHLWLRIVHGV